METYAKILICLLPLLGLAMALEDIEVERHCGYSKGCLMTPDSCRSIHECNYLFSFRDNGSYIDFEMSAHIDPSERWLAVGFSSDQKMGDDSVLECVRHDDGGIRVYSSYNARSTADDNYNVRRQLPGNAQHELPIITAVEGRYRDGILQCKFSRLKHVEPERDPEERLFDLSKKWYLLMAKGAVTDTGEKVKHSDAGGTRPLSSTTKADLRSTGPLSGNQCDADNMFIRVHGVLMVIAWIGCISCGILIARYYKFTWPGTTIAGEAVWFQLHRFLQIIAILFIFVAIVLIFIDIGGWINNDSSLAHALCGIIAASFAVLQPFFALCRCHPGTKNRPIFNWIHWFVGSVAHILALVAIFLAVDIGKTCLKPYVDYILVAFVIFHVIIEIILEIHACCYRNSKADTRELVMNNYGQFMPEREREEVHGSVFQQCVLAIYGLVVFGIVMALVVIILIS